jgi:hypothetical protein
MGYSLACMLNTERREEMLDGGLMYANADNMTSALVPYTINPKSKTLNPEP